MYKELLFCSKVDILNDPFTEVHLVQHDEVYILHVLTEILAAHTEVVFLIQTMKI